MTKAGLVPNFTIKVCLHLVLGVILTGVLAMNLDVASD
jgi:hypothetical protein